jgi:ABC-2 type transport system permease protein
MRKIKALLQYEFKKMTVWKPYILTLIVQPVAYLLLFAVAMSGNVPAVMYEGKELPYLLFILPGLIAVQTYQQFTMQVSLSANDKRWGLFRMLVTAGVQPAEYILARILNQSIVVTIQGFFISLIGWLLVGKVFISPQGCLTIVFVGLAAITFWTTLGIAVGLQVDSEEKRDILWALLSLPLMFSSSAFYSLKDVPIYIMALSYINPLTYTADVMRAGFYGNLNNVIWKILLMLGLAAVGWISCILVVRRTKLIPEEK